MERHGVGMDEGSPFELVTRRPRTSMVEVLEAGPTRAEALAELVVREMDSGEGWTASAPGSWWWFPARLGVRVGYSPPDADAQVDVRIHVVRGASLTDELNQWMNDLNAQSLGWWWWFDDDEGDVFCSQRCEAEPTSWWWPFLLSQRLPHAVTIAEAMAEILAEAGHGSVAVAAHPHRGPRPVRDGWLLGVELGPRDMSGSLDPWVSEYELARLRAGIAVVTGTESHDVSAPLQAVIRDQNGDPAIALRRHWHASWGWGWQVVTLTGLRAPGRRFDAGAGTFAIRLNREQAADAGPANRLGGWVYDQDLGMIHVTFLPAMQIDMLMSMAGPSIGDVAALLTDIPRRWDDMQFALREAELVPLVREPVPQEATSLLQSTSIRLGPIGWSYETGTAPPPSSSLPDATPGTWAADQPDSAWNVPKHMPVCGFGIFNPMGPTVSSLEVSWQHGDAGLQFALFHVMRHPHSPEVTLLGVVDDGDELGNLIRDCLSDRSERSVMGSGPEWVDIWGYAEHVVEGLRTFAAGEEGSALRAEADLLMNNALTPWARVSGAGDVEGSVWDPDADPIGCWIDAVTSYEVAVGQQLFMRSAWEGALAYRTSNWDPAAAEAAADAARRAAQERLSAEIPTSD